jgi:hypothetical protein
MPSPGPRRAVERIADRAGRLVAATVLSKPLGRALQDGRRLDALGYARLKHWASLPLSEFWEVTNAPIFGAQPA